MRKIAYIPLDDRPVNLSLTVNLARLGDLELLTPNKEDLGIFFKEGKTENIKLWLKDKKVEALILSLDMLAYGGLIASRTDKKPFEDVIKTIEFLKEYKKENKETKIYAFSNIMRLSISVLSNESQIWWSKINKYNELRYKVENLKNEELKEELKKIEASIPREVLQTYLRTRERNHKINLESIELVKDKIIDFLILSQEDCSEFGLHLMEHEILHKKINEYNLKEKIYVYPGADEIGQILVSRYVNDINDFSPRVYIDYDKEDKALIIPKFEDRSLKINLEEHLKSSKALIVKDYKDADYVLAVTTPHIPYIDKAEDNKEDYRKKEDIDFLIERIKKYISLGIKVSIADLAFANGGDEYLIKRLREENIILKVIAYGAWNTAGNAMGTSIAHGNLITALENNNNLNKEKSKESLVILMERYCDDFIYQSIIRKETNKLVEKENLSIFNMKEKNIKVDNFVRNYLEKIMKDYFEKSNIDYLKLKGKIKDLKLEAHLPWNRTFEAECSLIVSIKEEADEN